eukprot:Pgem_evm1s5400
MVNMNNTETLDVAAHLAAQNAKFSTTKVNKEIQLDLGNLTAFDDSPVNEKKL